MTSPLFELDLLNAIEHSVEDAFEAIVWRQVVGTTNPLRTNSLGGRWNPPGVEVLYSSLTQAGAEAELSALLERQSVFVTRERSTHRLRVRLSKVARISESDPFVAAGVNRDTILSDDLGLPQRIGAAADWLGIGGLIVPSARHDGSYDYFELVDTDAD